MFDRWDSPPPLEGELVPFVPDVVAAELSEMEVLAGIWSGQARQAREYALELQAVAQLAHRRPRTGELSTADGRGGPGVDSRALARPELGDVREDFVAEL